MEGSQHDAAQVTASSSEISRTLTPSDVVVAEWMNSPQADGRSEAAYVVRPLGGTFPGVVLLHHRDGLDQGTRECAFRVANHGNIVIVPNLHAIDAPGLPCEEAAVRVRSIGGVADSTALAAAAGARDLLSTLAGWNGKAALVGFCSGGRQAYVAAATLPFDAAVVCYGGRIVASPDDLNERRPVSPLSMTEKISCPILLIFGDRDRNPSPEHAVAIEAELRRFHKDYEIATYRRAGHAFLDAYRDTYSAINAKPAWDRIAAFLTARLD